MRVKSQPMLEEKAKKTPICRNKGPRRKKEMVTNNRTKKMQIRKKRIEMVNMMKRVRTNRRIHLLLHSREMMLKLT